MNLKDCCKFVVFVKFKLMFFNSDYDTHLFERSGAEGHRILLR